MGPSTRARAAFRRPEDEDLGVCVCLCFRCGLKLLGHEALSCSEDEDGGVCVCVCVLDAALSC